jgi:hypothetical protein
MSTYTLINSNTLSANAASVTFSSIPSTYTDLVLRVSARNNDTGTSFFRVTVNGDTTTNYSNTTLIGSGTAVTSGRNSSTGYFGPQYIPSSSNTSNTFSSTEFYFANYLSTSAKPFSFYSTEENNAAGSYMIAQATLYRGTSISSITLDESFGSLQFVSGSSFYLYGISNA